MALPSQDAIDAEKRRRFSLPEDHVFIEPRWSKIGTAPIFVPPESFSWNKIRGCWVAGKGKETKYFHGLLRLLKSTFYPNSNFGAIRRVRRGQQERLQMLGLDTNINRLLPCELPIPTGSAVSLTSEQDGLQAGREVDDQIRCAINLYQGNELPFKYTYLRFAANDAYLRKILAFRVHMPAHVFGRLGPIVQFWLHEMCRLKWRGLQSQGAVYHEGLRLATAFDVIALDTETNALLLIENKNSKSNYFTTGATAMLPPFQDKLDSAFNQAQLQAKFTAFLVECTYNVRLERLYVIRTQLGCFQTYLVEPWVHERFDDALAAVIARTRFVFDMRKMDVAPPGGMTVDHDAAAAAHSSGGEEEGEEEEEEEEDAEAAEDDGEEAKAADGTMIPDSGRRRDSNDNAAMQRLFQQRQQQQQQQQTQQMQPRAQDMSAAVAMLETHNDDGEDIRNFSGNLVGNASLEQQSHSGRRGGHGGGGVRNASRGGRTRGNGSNNDIAPIPASTQVHTNSNGIVFHQLSTPTRGRPVPSGRLSRRG